jgi:Tol biopolymer transport system component
MYLGYYAMIGCLVSILVITGCNDEPAQTDGVPVLQTTENGLVTPVEPNALTKVSSVVTPSQINFNSKIVFTGFPGYQIYTINQDGSQLTQLTDEITDGSFVGLNFDPTWSPDGTKIAFSTARKTHELDIISNPYAPSPSADIYIMNADGTNQTRITTNMEPDRSPSWSPDGKNIAFVAFRKECNGQELKWGSYADIYIINVDDSQLTRVTTCLHVLGPIAWSSNGQKIAFSLSDEDPDSLNHLDIYVINVDGSGLKRLTTAFGEDRSPQWSPSGQQIAFMSRRDNTPTDAPPGTGEIYLMNSDGSEQINITQSPWHEDTPSWSSDGKLIVYEAVADGMNNQIYIMDADGKFQTPITESTTIQGLSPEFHP